MKVQSKFWLIHLIFQTFQVQISPPTFSINHVLYMISQVISTCSLLFTL